MNIEAPDHSPQVSRNAGYRRCAVVLGIAFISGCLDGCGGRASTDAEPKPVGGPALVRRLTESEYRATIANIFGSDVPVVARFGRPLRSQGLIAVGTSEAGMTPYAVEQYDDAALGVANAVVSTKRRAEFVPCTPQPKSAFDESCARHFIDHYGTLLFRRPLTARQMARYVGEARDGSSKLGSFYEGLKYALVGMMTSPDFLLRIERTKPDPYRPSLRQLDAYSKATRLSYFLTNSAPDQELLRAAAAGELDTRKGLAHQVDRLIASPHFKDAVRAFFRDMLEFDQFSDLTKDSQIYPAYTSEVAKDAQEQTLRTITYLLIDRNGDYRDLFTTRVTFLTRALGVIYRVPVAKRNGWEKFTFPLRSDREGIQNEVSFLALHAHPGSSSPTLRGKALREIFLCQEVPDPPPKVNLVQTAAIKEMPTARMRVAAHLQQPTCAGCHRIMDPPGLGFENFDGVGKFRDHENGVRIDASGILDGIAFKNPKELAQVLHDHRETPRCLVERMYRFAVGRDITWGERYYIDYLIRTFAAEHYRVPALMRTIALSANFFAISTPADRSGSELQAHRYVERKEDRT